MFLGRSFGIMIGGPVAFVYGEAISIRNFWEGMDLDEVWRGLLSTSCWLMDWGWG